MVQTSGYTVNSSAGWGDLASSKGTSDREYITVQSTNPGLRYTGEERGMRVLEEESGKAREDGKIRCHLRFPVVGLR